MSTEIVEVSGNLRGMDVWVLNRMITCAAGSKASSQTRDTLRQEISEAAADFAGPNPTPDLKALGDTAALAWFGLRMAEAQYLGLLNSGEGMSVGYSEYHQRRIERATRRLMAILKTLAMIRRLGVPSVQINVAQQQVNVAGPGAISSSGKGQ